MAAVNQSTTKAVKASIDLGDLNLNVFKLEDGSYRLSQTQVAETVEKDEATFRRWLKLEKVKAMRCGGFNPDILKATVEGSKGKANLVTIDLAVGYWTKEAVNGNTKSALLLGACATESIERRADKQFGIERSEQERNERLKSRMQGKIARRKLTDSIKDYLQRHPYLGERYCNFIYSDVSDCLNVVLFGMKAAPLCIKRGCPSNKLRDTHSAKDLNTIEHYEQHAMKLIDKFDQEPLAAMNEAIEFYS